MQRLRRGGRAAAFAVYAAAATGIACFAAPRTAVAAESGAYSGAVVVIDPAKTVSADFHGLGVQWDPFEHQPSPADWRLIERRVDYVRSGYLRVMTGLASYFQRLRCGRKKPRYVWNDGSPSDQAGFKRLTDILDYAQSRKIDVILGEWGIPSPIFKIDETDPRWPKAIAGFVKYLRGMHGYTVVKYYNCINELNGNWSGNKNYESWSAAIRNLHQAFDASGLSRSVGIVGPDATVAKNWTDSWVYLNRAVKEHPALADAWDLHWYATDDEINSDTIEQTLLDKAGLIKTDDPKGKVKLRSLCESGILTGKVNGDQQPRVKTYEYGAEMADYVAQVGRAGWEGALAWDLDDAMHSVGGHDEDPPTADPAHSQSVGLLELPRRAHGASGGHANSPLVLHLVAHVAPISQGNQHRGIFGAGIL